MKITKLILAFGAMLISSIGFSQVSADLNVVLADIQSISVASGQETVTLTLDDVADYQNGVNSTQLNHLNIVSTQNFDVTAVANQDLTMTGNANTIPVTTVELTATPSANNPGDGTLPTMLLSKVTATNLVTGASANLNANYDVDYAVTGGADYLNQPTGTYVTTITYTLVPQ